MKEIAEARKVFDLEIDALIMTRDALGDEFIEIVNKITECKKKVVLCGMGKSGHIARKIAATLSSLGTPSFFLHPSEAAHGDLGTISKGDVIILISHSGASQEIVNLIPSLKLIQVTLIGITSREDSILARECDIVQIMPPVNEACNLNLAPTSSTTCTLVYGDSLAVVASQKYGFNINKFALFHPSGTLGDKAIVKVSDIMAKKKEIPIVDKGCKITKAIIEMSKKGLGVVAVVNSEGILAGLLTDGDLRRAIERKVDLYNNIIDSIMTYTPQYIEPNLLAIDALNELKKYSLNNFPVVDEEKHVIGMLTWQMIVKAGII